jgi:hypothetical protein
MGPMKPVVWMAAGSAVSCAAAITIAGAAMGRELVLGMLGPLIVVSMSWAVVEQTYRSRPDRVTSVMLRALAGKVVFFAAYVAMALSLLRVRPAPFVASFTAYFVALYFVEALCLRRLFAGGMRAGN